MRLLPGCHDVASLIDPSQLLRPEAKFADKPIACFRDYAIDKTDVVKERVRITYESMHTHQTVAFVEEKKAKWLQFNHYQGSIRDALEKLNDLVDESDPDVDMPNIVHAFQTAERIRQDHPNVDWFHLTGLIHDLGKIMAFYDEPQWAVVGDTFVVGCEWSPHIVYRNTSFQNNIDGHDPRYNTKYGRYAPHCGLEAVTMSWGHDEYLYQVLRHNSATLPDEAMFMIRFHSFYPWHTANDYDHLTTDRDNRMKRWVQWFNEYDLYTKSSVVPDIDDLWPYYQSLIDKYIPGVINW